MVTWPWVILVLQYILSLYLLLETGNGIKIMEWPIKISAKVKALG